MEYINLPSKKKWVKVKLGDIANTITKGSTPTTYGFNYLDKGIPFIKIENIENDKINNGSIKQFISNEAHEYQSRSQLKEGDILFSIAGTIGKTCIVTRNDIPSNTNQALSIIRGTNKYLLPKFLKLQFLSMLSISIKKKARGGAMNNISLNDLKKMDILLPSIREQNRIVEKIEELFSELDKATDDLQKTQEQLKIYRQAVLKAAFEGKLTEEWRKENNNLTSVNKLLQKISEDKDMIEHWNSNGKKENTDKKIEKILYTLPLIPFIWKWIKIRNTSYYIQYGYTKSASKEPVGPRFLRITDIQNNKVEWEKVPYCKVKNNDKDKYILENNDILFARTGATVGKSYIIKGKIPESIFASYLIRVKLSNLINKLYVFYFFQSSFYWKQIKEGQVGTGQPNFNGTKLGRLTIPICNLVEQNQIVKEIESRLSVCDKLEESIRQSLRKIDHLRQSILKKAFEGKLVSQNPEDEPAEKLLERIKQEKEKFELSKKKRKKR